MRSIATDGGNSEVKAAYESTQLAKEACRAADPLFPQCRYIFRDVPHRYRSVQKAFWAKVDEPVRNFLNIIVNHSGSADRSFLSLLQHSRRLQLLFMEKQAKKPQKL
ncbi:MAG TPA: hypothetical protein HPP54_10615 [Nitrospinae bacterium]|nr:hypothetical protein [Nitrospinota bacterium]